MKTVFAVIATALVLTQPLWAIMPAPSEASQDPQTCKMILDIAKRFPPDQATKLLQLMIEAYPNTSQAKEAAKLLKAMNKAKPKAQILHSDSVPSSYFDGRYPDFYRFTGRQEAAELLKQLNKKP